MSYKPSFADPETATVPSKPFRYEVQDPGTPDLRRSWAAVGEPAMVDRVNWFKYNQALIDDKKFMFDTVSNYIQASDSTTLLVNSDTALLLGTGGTSRINLATGSLTPAVDDDIEHGNASFRWKTGDYKGKVRTAGQFESTLVTGTAPLVVASTTSVANLNADLLDGKHVGTSGDTIPVLGGANIWGANQRLSSSNEFQFGQSTQKIYSSENLRLDLDSASFIQLRISGTVKATLGATSLDVVDLLKATSLESTVATGTAPLAVASTTVVANLNVAKLNDKASTDLLLVDGSQALSADWDVGAFEIRAQTFQSDVATGTAPLVIASKTVVPNLNVDQVDGKDSTDLLLVDGSQALSADWDVGSFDVRAAGIFCDSDAAGLSGAIGLTNVTIGDNTLTNVIHLNRNTAFTSATQAVWVKITVNGTATYLPGWQ